MRVESRKSWDSNNPPALAPKRNWQCFDWLLEDRYHLRGNLRQVRTAIRRGFLEGPACEPQRLALSGALSVLVKDPETPLRALCTILQIYFEMEEQNRSRSSAV